MKDLSIIIPARNEEWLDLTVKDILKNIRADTEIIVVLDGYTPQTLTRDPRITIIYNPEPKGQRAASNQAAKIAKGKYIMKIDAHCAVSEGFDQVMLDAFKETGDDVTMVPVLKNLHVFDWVCSEGHRWYQGKRDICEKCGKKGEKEVLWQVKPSPARFTFMFDKTMHFQYWGELAKREENRKGFKGNPMLRETLSIQGSCFMLTKERYFALDICSEDFHSWGQQGVEVSCKTHLSGGYVVANLNCWYAHLFRTNNFGGFPYSNPENLIQENRELSRELFQRNKWSKAIHTFQWLLDKFNPVPEWSDGLTKGIIFYTDNQLDEKIAEPVKKQLYDISVQKNIPITSASLKRMNFGVKNIRFPSLKRGYYAMHKQILGALENSRADYVFFTEHDVLYHPSHFDFVPQDKETFYFNNNVWKVDLETGRGVKVDKCEQLSGMCVYKETALKWIREKLKQLETNAFDGHYEPQGTVRGGWKSEQPNIDIRHNTNLTPSRWSKDKFRNQDNTIGWTEVDNEIPGWGDIRFILNSMK